MLRIHIELRDRNYRRFRHLIISDQCDGCGKNIRIESGIVEPLEFILSDGSHITDEVVLCSECSKEVEPDHDWPIFKDFVNDEPDLLPF